MQAARSTNDAHSISSFQTLGSLRSATLGSLRSVPLIIDNMSLGTSLSFANKNDCCWSIAGLSAIDDSLSAASSALLPPPEFMQESSFVEPAKQQQQPPPLPHQRQPTQGRKRRRSGKRQKRSKKLTPLPQRAAPKIPPRSEMKEGKPLALVAAAEMRDPRHRTQMMAKARRKTRFGRTPSKIRWLVGVYTAARASGGMRVGGAECAGLRVLDMAVHDVHTYTVCLEPRCVVTQLATLADVRAQTVLYRMELEAGNMRLRAAEAGSDPLPRAETLTSVRQRHQISADNWDAFRVLHVDRLGSLSFCVSLAEMRLFVESHMDHPQGPLLDGCLLHRRYPRPVV